MVEVDENQRPRTVQHLARSLATDLWRPADLEGLYSEGASPAFTFDAGPSVHEIDADGLNSLFTPLNLHLG